MIRRGLVAVLLVAGCSALMPRAPLPDLLPDAVRIATNDEDPGTEGPILCTPAKALDPVLGRLDGDAARDGHSVWLVADDGRVIHVLWPRGFSARFTYGVELINRGGRIIASRGSRVDLNLTWPEAAGTIEDPYRPFWINGECYPPYH